jgi:Aspartyl protease
VANIYLLQQITVRVADGLAASNETRPQLNRAMPRLITLAIFLSASIGRIDGYNLDHGDAPRKLFRGDSGTEESNVSSRRTNSGSLSDSDTLEECLLDFSDEECFHFEPLQIPCEINGYIIPAIVDTGAQVTVMSESCAKRCRVANQIDGRFSGQAVGIGSSDILGRIDELLMRVGPITYHNKVSILRQSRVDLIIGLDFLRRFGAEINLEKKMLKLTVRGRIVRIPFISDTYEHLGPSSNKYLNMNDRDSLMDENDDFSDADEDDYLGSNAGGTETNSRNFPLSDLVEIKDYMKNKGSSAGNSNGSKTAGQNSKYENNEREFVILNSKLNRGRNYPEDEDDNDDGAKKSFLSMEGV